MRKYVVPAAKRIGADMLEFVAPEIGEVISGRKSFKSAAKSVGKPTLKKQLGKGSRGPKGAVGVREGGSKQRRIIPTTSTKQSSRSRRDTFTNISRWSCQTTIFGTNLLWQCLEILDGKSQLLTMSCGCMKKNFPNYLTWWKLHRVLISNGLELLRWFETVFFGIEAQICLRTWFRYLRV